MVSAGGAESGRSDERPSGRPASRRGGRKCTTGFPASPPPDSAAVRRSLIEVLRLDLIGPRPGDAALQRERLPQALSRWYLTGFLAPAGASDAQRAQDAEEELDAPAEPMQGSNDSSTPERGSGKRAFLPSSMGLSVLVDAETEHFDVALTWGDYAPESGAAAEGGGVGETEAGGDGDGAASRRRFMPWVRRPRAEKVAIDLSTARVGTPVAREVPGSGGLELVCLVRRTRVRTVDGDRDARAVALFVVNRRPPAKDDDLQDTASHSRSRCASRPTGRSSRDTTRAGSTATIGMSASPICITTTSRNTPKAGASSANARPSNSSDQHTRTAAPIPQPPPGPAHR